MSKQYEISIEKDAEVSKMIKQLASRNRGEFDAAMEAVAGFIGDVVLNVVDQAPVVSNLFTTVSYAEGTAPSLPLDVYYDVRDRNYIQLWTQSAPGGLATSQVHGLNELMVSVYEVDSAVSMLKKYAKEARLDVLAATIERMAGEFLAKQEKDSANIISAALGGTTYTDITGATVPQGIRVDTANSFGMNDFNRLITLLQRIRPSWVGGTPTAGNIVSHLVGSPEFHEQLRSMAYQPQNTRSGKETTSGATSLSAPDSVREQVFNAAGNPSFFGVELLNVYEMGVGQAYNTLFANYIGATTVGGSAFTAASDEVIWALSLASNRRALTRLVQASEGGGTLQVMPDDSFPMRSEKLGFYSKLTEGRVVLDSRNLAFCVL